MARRLLLLNGLAVLGVVLNHSGGWGYIAMFWWTHRYLPVTTPNFDQMGTVSYYALRVIEQLMDFSVPAFLFVSGFFLAFAAGRAEASEGWSVAYKRIKTLLIAYILWSSVIYILGLLQGNRFSEVGYLKMLALGKAIGPYYYIPLLTQLFLLSPLIFPLARNHWKLLLLISALVQLSLQILRFRFFLSMESPFLEKLVRITPGWFFPGKAFWFVLGIIVNLHLEKFRLWATRYKWVLLAGSVLLLPLGILEWEALLYFSDKNWLPYYHTAIDSFYAFSFIFCFLAFDRVTFPLSTKISNLGTKSYGIYLVHALVIVYTSKAIYHIAPRILAYQILFQPILIALGIWIPLFLMAVANRPPMRRVYHYLFG